MPASTNLVIGFPRESGAGDRRTLLTPMVACVLAEAGFGVLAEPGIGAGVFYDDAELAAAGVRFANPDEVWAAPLVLRYKSANPDELSRLRPASRSARCSTPRATPPCLPLWRPAA
jgi:alanine dehydrogenase